MTQTNESKGSGSRILIVDDDVHTLDILRRWLTREGYRTLCADGGAACLDLLDQEGQGEADIDVIILDVMMPGIDGLQVCEQLRDKEAWRGIPIMLLTAKRCAMVASNASVEGDVSFRMLSRVSVRIWAQVISSNCPRRARRSRRAQRPSVR